MAKQNPSSERSKVRIFFVEGDFAPGDLHELTQALASAMKPGPVVVRHAVVGATKPAAGLSAPKGNGNAEQEPVFADADLPDDVEEVEDSPVARSAKEPGKPRSYRKPQPVDMDMSAGGQPFKEFASEKSPTSHRAKYLVAAMWLHEFGKLDPITADHVFTCYKAAGWTFDIVDPSVTLRQLKGEGLGNMNRGSFSINHLGIAEVERMNGPSA